MTDDPDRLPPGRLREVVTHLEMLKPPVAPPRACPADDACLLHVTRPQVPFYRFLYNTIGEPWLWRDRRRMTDAALEQAIQAPGVGVHVLMAGGQPAGYVELDRGRPEEVELVFCGLMPWAIGGGLGPWMLETAVRMAWNDARLRRLWVHTCCFDHPAALPMYERAGFVRCGTEVNLIPDPRLEGLLPRTAAPHVPLAREA